jgi:inhibitor of KinA
MRSVTPYKISALGDSAVVIDFGNLIDEAINKKVLAIFHYLKKFPFKGMMETVPAYSSLTVFYDVAQIRLHEKTNTALEWVTQTLEVILKKNIDSIDEHRETIRIPVLYSSDLTPDLQQLEKTFNISKEEIIHLHTSQVYRVYMLGFLPGFPYMGVVNDRIAFPRKQQPAPVKAGSVAIAGKQTGIYPLPSPGGWQVIGKTPVKMFDVLPESSPQYSCFLQPGDHVQFYAIRKDEYEYLEKNSLKENESEGTV